ncbi:sulfite exporter TauE/SafE family protein [Oceaniglobus ichthyenteri]|uniref:sulfite exporter TauE/SafE family protein n=1 Tax=Oceaniglobus ichthyenteri TaxID=2136177 RepID=UPI000D3D9451|nr:sulfite exporter TauE/SafE family protein [Oceaniglobus ichthyenteri]
MELGVTFFAFAIPAVLFAGISKGGFAAGAAFAASPFLALILEPAAAIGLMLPLLMVMDITALRVFWRRWDWPVARRLMIGGLPGVVAGAALYTAANADVLRFMIGVIALGFVAYQIARARGVLRFEGWRAFPGAGYFWGAMAGFTSFISHAGGPPAAVYLLTRGLDKTTYQATTVIVFFAINIFKAVFYAGLGIFTAETLWAGMFLIPVAFIGVFLGVWLHRTVSQRLFFGLTYVFLTATGGKLIFDALT